MNVSQLPLNALRAFEAAARNLSLTRAGLELRVTQAAVSHQVKALENILGAPLFRRLPRGLALTEEGEALFPVVSDAFRHISGTLERFQGGRLREVLTLGAVGTFVTGWLLPRLDAFHAAHPFVDLRLMINNNRVDLAGEGLDYAIRFGDGAWHGTEAVRLFEASLTPHCAPELARRLRQTGDLAGEVLLRSYRTDEWARWCAVAGLSCPASRGFVFDSSITMAEAALQGAGVALLPASMFTRHRLEGRLVCPFATEVTLGAYWLARLRSRPESRAMLAFRRWLLAASEAEVVSME